MSFWFGDADLPSNFTAAGGVAGLGEIVDAATKQMRMVENTTAANDALFQAYDDRIAAIRAATGQVVENPLRIAERLDQETMTAPRRRMYDQPLYADELKAGPAMPTNSQRQAQAFAGWLAEMEQRFPEHKAAIRADVPVQKDAEAIARKSDEDLARLMGSRPGIAGFGAAFWGGFKGSLSDPLQVATLFAGGGAGAGRTVIARMANVALKEALVNGAVEAAFQPQVQAWREKVGLPSGWAEGAKNVLFASVAGGVLGGGAEGIAAGARRLLKGAELDAAAEILIDSKPSSPDIREDQAAIPTQYADGEGDLYRVFHGTTEVFEEFDIKHAGKNSGESNARDGFFFTSDKRVAETYARKPGFLRNKIGTVKEQKLHLKNPYIVDYKGKSYMQVSMNMDLLTKQFSMGVPPYDRYDGIIFKNLDDTVGKNGQTKGGKTDKDRIVSDIYFIRDASKIKPVDAVPAAPSLSAQVRAGLDGNADAAIAALKDIREALPPEARAAIDLAETDAAVRSDLPDVKSPVHERNLDAAVKVAQDPALYAPDFELDPAKVDRIVSELVPDAPKRRKGETQSLADFLIRAGGIQDQKGEITALGLQNASSRFQGRLVRENGRPLDAAREIAAEAGFFNHRYGTPEEAMARSTVADLLDELDAGSRKVDGPDDDGGRAYVEGRVTELMRLAGPEVDEKLVARAVQRAERDGIDLVEAFDREAVFDDAAQIDLADALAAPRRADPITRDEPAGEPDAIEESLFDIDELADMEEQGMMIPFFDDDRMATPQQMLDDLDALDSLFKATEACRI